MMLAEILQSYDINSGATIQSYGSGLIHRTWKVISRSGDYILQKINDNVFKDPYLIAQNIEAISSFLKQTHPEYFFVAPVKTKNNESLVHDLSAGYFRLFPFVKNSHSYDVAQSPKQAFEAARQFGLFTKMLKDFPVEVLNITIPDFHNLVFRSDQFENALKQGNPERIKGARETIDFLVAHDDIVSTYRQIVFEQKFKLRVTHHDTKINNVLFDEHGEGICVIDLDTVMPGYFISDVGDMMRTYLSPASEEESDLSKIVIREEYFDAIAHGYLKEMESELNSFEKAHFVYAGLFMVYMQALRFLTDYLNNDVYYGSAYDGQNYVRAKNQVVLLERLLEKKDKLYDMVISITRNSH